jgi:hypothetical protein
VAAALQVKAAGTSLVGNLNQRAGLVDKPQQIVHVEQRQVGMYNACACLQTALSLRAFLSFVFWQKNQS